MEYPLGWLRSWSTMDQKARSATALASWLVNGLSGSGYGHLLPAPTGIAPGSMYFCQGFGTGSPPPCGVQGTLAALGGQKKRTLTVLCASMPKYGLSTVTRPSTLMKVPWP